LKEKKDTEQFIFFQREKIIMLLKDKVLIISGIGPGLGVKLAVEAAREGAKV